MDAKDTIRNRMVVPWGEVQHAWRLTREGQTVVVL